MLLQEKSINKFSQKDQILILTDASWEDYQTLDSSEDSHCLISYLNHEIVIMSPGRNHERIAEIIGILIEAYCEKVNLRYFPFGSTRLQVENREGKEPDTAYAFAVDKNQPDLAVEVNFTIGSINDLTKYKYLQIKEVWLWHNQELKFYLLKNNSYEKITESIFLKGLKSSDFTSYVNRGLTESPLDIKRDWLDFLSR